ncbi:MAG TPA: bifunctional hydroxymethylpyrimidine kinase/phosphomethylpyrimidine kinase [Dermatophilaceae bacterium]|nr:bifunctional hydroxymethylpyrimidine kinase/phosphomethylpyrimidine kinase [Dermatophilaceae bacterium]
MTRPPVTLTIAGSDPSGGAGIQADLKTFSALGAYGMSVITALTAQNTHGVTGIHPVPADFVAQQLDTLLADVRIDAVKIGMLANAGIAGLLRDYLRPDGGLGRRFTVLDPVSVATSGDQLLDDDAVDAVRALLPLVDVVTPNLLEAALLTGMLAAASIDGMRALARALRAMGARRALVKGGHLSADQDAVDLWLDHEGERLFTSARVATTNTHGTGCTLSSAVTALRPQREDWATSVSDAKCWLTEALTYGDQLHIGSGHGPVHHFNAFAPTWRVQ